MYKTTGSYPDGEGGGVQVIETEPLFLKIKGITAGASGYYTDDGIQFEYPEYCNGMGEYENEEHEGCGLVATFIFVESFEEVHKYYYDGEYHDYILTDDRIYHSIDEVKEILRTRCDNGCYTALSIMLYTNDGKYVCFSKKVKIEFDM